MIAAGVGAVVIDTEPSGDHAPAAHGAGHGGRPPVTLALAREPRTAVDIPPPHDLRAESAVLGYILISGDPATILRAAGAGLDPDDFYQPSHVTLYRHLLGRLHDGAPVDPISVAAALTDAGWPPGLSPNYLHTLIAVTPAGELEHWARIIVERALDRAEREAHIQFGQALATPGADRAAAKARLRAALDASDWRRAYGAPVAGTASGWAPVDLAAALDGWTPPPPSALARTDGRCLFYAGKVHVVFGASESGKSWLCLVATAQEIDAGRQVLYVDFEDDAGPVVARLLALGCARDDIRARLHYVRPDRPLTPGGADARALVDLAARCSLAVLDGVSEAMVLHGYDPDRGTTDIVQFLERVVRPLADAGPAVVQIDHVAKGADPDTADAIGAQHKRSGIDGASYHVTATRPFGIGLHGEARIVVRKDRPGQVRAYATGEKHDRVAALHLDSHAATTATAWLEPLDTTAGGASGFRPTALMERVSCFVEKNPGASKNAIELGVSGKVQWVRNALGLLVAEGYVAAEKDGQAVRHTSIKQYREGVDETPGSAS